MRSTHDHEDRVRYWLTDTVGNTLIPAVETTDVIRNTDSKQVTRNMGRYFQHNFMLFTT